MVFRGVIEAQNALAAASTVAEAVEIVSAAVEDVTGVAASVALTGDLERASPGEPRVDETEFSVGAYGTLSLAAGADHTARITAELLAGSLELALARFSWEPVQDRRRVLLGEPTQRGEVGSWTIDLPSGDLWWSEEVYRIRRRPLDYDPRLPEGLLFYHPDDRRVIEAAVERLKATGESYDLELREVTPDGELYWVRTVGVPEYDDDGTLVSLRGTFEDITERKEAEEKLRETTQAIATAPLGIALSAPRQTANRITHANAALCALTDRTEAAVVGRDPLTLFAPNTDPAIIEAFTDAVERGTNATGEVLVARADDDTVWCQVDVAPIHDENGTVTAFGWFLRDTTTRKTYERELEHHRDSLELLTEMVSHDLRNDLQVVQGFAELVETTTDDTHVRDYAATIGSKTTHAVALLRTVRDLTETMRRPADDVAAVSLHDTLTAQIDDVTSTRDAHITIDGGIPDVSISADPLLGSVFRNLLENAIVHTDTPDIHVAVDATADAVAVHVADDGPGIPDTRKNAVFGRGEHGLASPGTGLGLYLVDTLVHRYGGHVTITDRADFHHPDIPPATRGAVFTVSLPRYSPPPGGDI